MGRYSIGNSRCYHKGKRDFNQGSGECYSNLYYGLFQGAKKYCEEMNSVITRFQWGQRGNKGRIHWKKWESMRKAKVEGGMRFKEFKVFNKTLLAKQGQRLVQNKEALWAKILKGLYFPNCYFLKAKKRSKCIMVLEQLPKR